LLCNGAATAGVFAVEVTGLDAPSHASAAAAATHVSPRLDYGNVAGNSSLSGCLLFSWSFVMDSAKLIILCG
jgi:hypothetical protein